MAAFGPFGVQSMVKQVVLHLLLKPDSEARLGVPVLYGGSAFELYIPLSFGGVTSGDMDLILEREADDADSADRFSDLHDFMELVRDHVRGLCGASSSGSCLADELTCRVNFVSCGTYSMHVYVGRVKTVDITLMSGSRARLWRELFPRQYTTVCCDPAVVGLPSALTVAVISAGELWRRLHGVATGARLPDGTPNSPPETNLLALCAAVRRMSLLLAFGTVDAVAEDAGVDGDRVRDRVGDTAVVASLTPLPSTLDYIRVLVSKADRLYREWLPLAIQPRSWFLSLDSALFEGGEAVSMMLARRAARRKPLKPLKPRTGLTVCTGVGMVAVKATTQPHVETLNRKEAAAARRDSNRKVAAAVNDTWKAALTAAVGDFMDRMDKQYRAVIMGALKRTATRVATAQRAVRTVKVLCDRAAATRAKHAQLARQVVTGLTTIREQTAAMLAAATKFQNNVMAEVIKYDERLMVDPAALGRTERVNRVYAQLLNPVVTALASSFGGATDLFPLDSVAVFGARALMTLPPSSTPAQQAGLTKRVVVYMLRALCRTMARVRATAATKVAVVMGRPCVPMPMFRVHDLALLSSTRGAPVKVTLPAAGEPATVVAGTPDNLHAIWDLCTAMLRGVSADTVVNDLERKTLDGYWTIMHQIANEADNVCSSVETDVLSMALGVVTAPAVHMVADAHMQLSMCGLAAKQFSGHVSAATGTINPLLEAISHVQAMAERLL